MNQAAESPEPIQPLLLQEESIREGLDSALAASCLLRLCLNRPQRGNALSSELVMALQAAWTQASRRQDLRLAVFEGAGRHFCTGFDLSALENENDDSLLARFIRIELLLQSIHAAPFTTVALAQGRTVGAGADLFCACQERWIIGDASFAFPGAGFGLVLGSSRLAETVGPATARAWIEHGQTIPADEALACGLATRRLEPEQVSPELTALHERCSRLTMPTHTLLHAALDDIRRPRGTAGDSEDLRRLALSAAAPGLVQRIVEYRAWISR